MSLAPIALFTYKRLDTLKITLNSLQKNNLAKQSKLIVFSDAGKNEQDAEKVKNVRDFLKSIKGFKEVELIFRPQNFGLYQNITQGITEIINVYDKIIVMEDDLQVSPVFLDYMNFYLDFFKDNPKVASITGFMYPVKTLRRKPFFLSMGESLAWGSWKRVWKLFNKYTPNDLIEKTKPLKYEFNFWGTENFYRLLETQIHRNTSWAIRWYAIIFINKLLTLYPSRSYVSHIGEGQDSTNVKTGNPFRINNLNIDFKPYKNIPVKENLEMRKKVALFFHQSAGRKLSLKDNLKLRILPIYLTKTLRKIKALL